MNTKKPKLVVLGTGGTIAGEGSSPVKSTYTSGKVSADQLLSTLPASVFDLVQIQTEQFSNLASQDIGDQFLITLALRVNEILAQPDIDGIVITHGTDTLEETAYFLNLVINSNKAVVLTGAMRPSTATSADGPMNIVNAITVAASTESDHHGVMVVMNEAIFGARDVVKSNTTAVSTFAAPNFGPLGHVRDLEVSYHRKPTRKHTTSSELQLQPATKTLPLVGIVYAHAGHDFMPVKAFCDAGYQGIVFAGMGNGNLSHQVLDQLKQCHQQNICFIRSSRCFSGATSAGEIDDEQYGLLSARDLNPQKTRILLQLALLKTSSHELLNQFFQQY